MRQSKHSHRALHRRRPTAEEALPTFLALAVGFLSSMIGQTGLTVPSVYPTGTTIYQPDRAWNGYVIHDAPDGQGAILIDMNGNLIRQWTQIAAVPGPFRILPGGYLIGGDVRREPHQEAIGLVQLDWRSMEVWRFQGLEKVLTRHATDDGKWVEGETVWSSRQHHDWQREGSPVGYYAPGAEPKITNGRTLILAHKNVSVPEISPKRLEDDYIYEITWEGEVLWDWLASDHFDEFGFSEQAKNAIHRSARWNEDRESADWLHINSVSYVGPNRWYEQGDERFHPDNIIFSAREANVIGVIGRDGHLAWRLGPDYSQTESQRKLGQIIGQHNPHLIPEGLPGAGNILVFDNGGSAGYGFAHPAAPEGVASVRRDFSRVVEFNPITLEVEWEYSISGTEKFRFFSHYVSNAQRLPNGNTMITEGAVGRIFEVTPEKEIVWEYVSPFFGSEEPISQRIFRAYRLPYDWIPQLDRPVETPVVPPDLRTFRVQNGSPAP